MPAYRPAVMVVVAQRLPRDASPEYSEDLRESGHVQPNPPILSKSFKPCRQCLEPTKVKDVGASLIRNPLGRHIRPTVSLAEDTLPSTYPVASCEPQSSSPKFRTVKILQLADVDPKDLFPTW